MISNVVERNSTYSLALMTPDLVVSLDGGPGFTVTKDGEVYGTPQMLVDALGYNPGIIYEVTADGVMLTRLRYHQEEEIFVTVETSKEFTEMVSRWHLEGVQKGVKV